MPQLWVLATVIILVAVLAVAAILVAGLYSAARAFTHAVWHR